MSVSSGSTAFLRERESERANVKMSRSEVALRRQDKGKQEKKRRKAATAAAMMMAVERLSNGVVGAWMAAACLAPRVRRLPVLKTKSTLRGACYSLTV